MALAGALPDYHTNAKATCTIVEDVGAIVRMAGISDADGIRSPRFLRESRRVLLQHTPATTVRPPLVLIYNKVLS